MADQAAKIDPNYRKTLLAITDNIAQEIRRVLVDPTTGRIKCEATFAGSNVIQNPMTDWGDMVYGIATGVPAALPIGSADQVLTVKSVAGHLIPQWSTGVAGFFKLDQTTPQTVINGMPIFDLGIQTNGGIINYSNYIGTNNILVYFDAADAFTIRDNNLSSDYSQLGIGMNVAGGYSYIQNKKHDSGTELPLTFWSNTNERMRINTNGTIKLNAYTTNGFVKFTGADGTLGVDTNSYLSLDQTAPQTVVNGRPIFSQGFQLGTSPTVGTFSEGKMYYNSTWKTVAAEISSALTLPLAQLELRYVYNATGSQIDKGRAVYTSGVHAGSPDTVTVALAQSNSSTTSFILGVTAQDIPAASFGFIVVRGNVENINTNVAGWTAGDVLYLSESVAGGLTNVAPDAPNFKVRMGRLITKSATVGVINVRLNQIYALSDLSDVTMGTPTLDQILRYNGVSWVNGQPTTSSASAGIDFFNETPQITGIGVNNSIQILTLGKSPVTTAEQTITVVIGNDTVAMTAWLYNTALGRTSIDAGIWNFHTYAACSSILGGRVSSITRQLYSVLTQDGGSITVTTTGGPGTSRTATASGGAPFAITKIDASGTNTVASYLQTPQGIYQISARADDQTVTITVPVTYSNEAGVIFNVWKKLFGITTSTITTTGTDYIDYPVSTAQAAFTVTINHKLGSIMFGTSNTAADTVTVAYNGNLRNSYFSTPLITLHGDLAGLQGGTGSEYYHLTLAEHTVATQAATSVLDGYLSHTDWGTFNGKANANLGNLATVAINTTLLPAANDGAGLGDGTHAFSDLFLASGAVINFANSNVTITHSSALLDIAGGALDIHRSITVYTDNLDTAAARQLAFLKKRLTSPFTVQADDALGAVTFQGYDSAAYQIGAGITAYVDGTPGANDMPTRLTFTTTPDGSATPVERMRIDNAGVITSYIGIVPDANDGAYLGTTALSWSDLFLASGGVINWANGNVTLTHSAGVLTLAATTLAIGATNLTMTGSIADTTNRVTKGWFTNLEITNVPTVNGTSMPLKTDNLSVFAATTSAQLAGVISDETGSGALVFATSPGFTTAANPVSNDGATLGTTALGWSDLFLALGGVINWNNGDVTITHSANSLAFAGGSSGYTFDTIVSFGDSSFTNTSLMKGLLGFSETTPVLVLGSEKVQFEDPDGTHSDFTFRVANAAQTALSFASSAGTLSVPTVTGNGADLGHIYWWGYDSAHYRKAAKIACITDGTPDANTMPGRIVFSTTAPASVTPTDRLILDSAGVLKPSSNDGVALGTTALKFSDLFLASGAVINFNNGSFTITGGANIITLGGSGANGNKLVLAAGGTALGSLNIPAGTLVTTAVDGDIEMDANAFYACTDAGNRGVIPVQNYIRQHADRAAFANNTNQQAIFDSVANGTLTLETGAYEFECLIQIKVTSATSGNIKFSLAGAGGGTFANILYVTLAIDAANNTNTAPTMMSQIVSTQTATDIATASTATVTTVLIEGSFECTIAGTLIPSVAQTTAVTTAVTTAGSYFRCNRVGATTMVSVGQWS